MGLTDRRRIHREGRFSRSVILPAGLRTGEFATLAANRLVLIDPRGEISPDVLLDLMEKYLEPIIWSGLLDQDKHGV